MYRINSNRLIANTLPFLLILITLLQTSAQSQNDYTCTDNGNIVNGILPPSVIEIPALCDMSMQTGRYSCTNGCSINKQYKFFCKELTQEEIESQETYQSGVHYSSIIDYTTEPCSSCFQGECIRDTLCITTQSSDSTGPVIVQGVFTSNDPIVSSSCTRIEKFVYSCTDQCAENGKKVRFSCVSNPDENTKNLFLYILNYDLADCPVPQECKEGKCISCIDPDKQNTDIFGKAYIVGQKEIPDTCSEDRTKVFESYCESDTADKVSTKEISCGQDKLCNKGVCLPVDRDADKVPDRRDKCLDTLFQDPVDNDPNSEEYGCSCSGGASHVTIENKYVSCSYLQSLDPCNNGIYDDEDLMVDCGGICPSCEGECKKLVNAPKSKINVLLVPIGYGSENYYDWVDKAGKEAWKLSTTPPFCNSPKLGEAGTAECNAEVDDTQGSTTEGEILFTQGEFTPMLNVWRLDGFYVNEQAENCFNNAETKKEVAKCLCDTSWIPQLCGNIDNRDYTSLCGGVDNVILLVNKEKVSASADSDLSFWGLSEMSNKFSLVYTSYENKNIISHEFAHAFCGLSDEYMITNVISYYVGNSKHINCDNFPLYCTNPDDPNTCIFDLDRCEANPSNCLCKWDPRYPDIMQAIYEQQWNDKGIAFPEDKFSNAGCIRGCDQSDALFRPANDYDFSLMNSVDYLNLGVGDQDMGYLNRVSYAWCKGLIDKAQK